MRYSCEHLEWMSLYHCTGTGALDTWWRLGALSNLIWPLLRVLIWETWCLLISLRKPCVLSSAAAAVLFASPLTKVSRCRAIGIKNRSLSHYNSTCLMLWCGSYQHSRPGWAVQLISVKPYVTLQLRNEAASRGGRANSAFCTVPCFLTSLSLYSCTWLDRPPCFISAESHRGLN